MGFTDLQTIALFYTLRIVHVIFAKKKNCQYKNQNRVSNRYYIEAEEIDDGTTERAKVRWTVNASKNALHAITREDVIEGRDRDRHEKEININ